MSKGTCRRMRVVGQKGHKRLVFFHGTVVWHGNDQCGSLTSQNPPIFFGLELHKNMSHFFWHFRLALTSSFRCTSVASGTEQRKEFLLKRHLTMVQNRKKHRTNSHPTIHSPTSLLVNEVSEWISEWVSEQANEWVSERANEWAQWRAWAKRTVWSKQMSERCEKTSKRTSEWPSTLVCIFRCSGPQCDGLTTKRSEFWHHALPQIKKEQIKKN